MPIYEYECGNCHCCFERKQRFDDEPVAACPQCQGKARRVFHSVPIIFKGSGFYVTDNRKSSGMKEKEIKETGKETHREAEGEKV